MVAKNLTLRLATLADSGAIAAMSRDLVEHGLGWSWTPQRVARHIRNKDTATVVACEADKVIGFAIMYFGEEHAHLNLLAVRPAYQRSGIGARLVGWLRDSCMVAGLAVIYCELRASNAGGRSFYLSLGFSETGTVPRYYFGVEAALCLALRLRPETQAS